jgi:hypothetical protein
MILVSDDGFESDHGRAGNSPRQNRENRVVISENDVGWPQILYASSFYK